MNISAIILNYNRYEDTISCVKSLLLSFDAPFCIVVIDNASTDDSVPQLSKWLQQIEIDPAKRQPFAPNAGFTTRVRGTAGAEIPLHLVISPRNGGYAAGNNLGITKALEQGADAVWILNNDTIVEPDALGCMRDRLFTSARPGLCGALLRYPDGLTQCRGGGYTNKLTFLSTLDGYWLPLEEARCDKAESVESRINFIYGACVMASKKFVETVGLMDEQFFLYCEEQDWAWRARGRFDISYAPDAIVTHVEGKSTGHASRCIKIRRLIMIVRSRLLLCMKHRPMALPIVLLSVCFASVRLCYRRLQKKWTG